MTAQTTFEATKHAIETRDADAMLALYADDAQMVEYDRDHPPAAPMRMTGREQLEPMVRDVFGREMAHEVADEVVGPDRFSFTEHCRYPGGEQVVSLQFFQLRDGRIVRNVMQQVWDD